MKRRCAPDVEARADEGGRNEETAVGGSREGREGSKGLEGPQRGVQAQAGRGREVDGKEAHRQGLEARRTGPEDSGPRSVPPHPASAQNLWERGPCDLLCGSAGDDALAALLGIHPCHLLRCADSSRTGEGPARLRRLGCRARHLLCAQRLEERPAQSDHHEDERRRREDGSRLQAIEAAGEEEDRRRNATDMVTAIQKTLPSIPGLAGLCIASPPLLPNRIRRLSATSRIPRALYGTVLFVSSAPNTFGFGNLPSITAGAGGG